jgi:flavin reductase (DIM6/NTAB) family NADH-FMN oxidoreductase RutF
MGKKKLGPQRLLYPMPAVLVGTTINEKSNFMTVAWCAIAAHKPPAVSVALQKDRYTLEGIRKNGTFSVNVPSSNMIKQADFCGVYSGKEKDKSSIFKAFYGTLETAPLIEECPLNLECKVLHYLDLGSHTLVVGEIIETYLSEDCLTNGKVNPEKIDPLIYAPGTMKYYRLGEDIGSAFKIGKA